MLPLSFDFNRYLPRNLAGYGVQAPERSLPTLLIGNSIHRGAGLHV